VKAVIYKDFFAEFCIIIYKYTNPGLPEKVNSPAIQHWTS